MTNFENNTTEKHNDEFYGCLIFKDECERRLSDFDNSDDRFATVYTYKEADAVRPQKYILQ